MEKRKDAAGYQHQCFTMMVLLNVIIVLFLTFTIVLTQYRISAAFSTRLRISSFGVPAIFRAKPMIFRFHSTAADIIPQKGRRTMLAAG